MEQYNPDNFLSDKVPYLAGTETIAKSGVFLKGQIFAIKADNKLYALDLADKDGAAIPYFVLDNKVDATNNDVVVNGYYVGAFNKDKLLFGSNVADNVFTACRKQNIYPVSFI